MRDYPSIKYVKPLDSQALTAQLKQTVAWYWKAIGCLQDIRPVLEKHIGQKITKRIEPLLQAAIGKNGTVHYLALSESYSGITSIEIVLPDPLNKIGGWNSVHLDLHTRAAPFSNQDLVRLDDRVNQYHKLAHELEPTIQQVDGLVEAWNGALNIMQGVNKQAEALKLDYYMINLKG